MSAPTRTQSPATLRLVRGDVNDADAATPREDAAPAECVRLSDSIRPGWVELQGFATLAADGNITDMVVRLEVPMELLTRDSIAFVGGLVVAHGLRDLRRPSLAVVR